LYGVQFCGKMSDDTGCIVNCADCIVTQQSGS